MPDYPEKAVVDAGVAVKWVIAEHDSERAAALARSRLSAPDLIEAECANILWVKVARGEIVEPEAMIRIARLCAAPVERIPCGELGPAALKLSIDLRHPAHDCLYLALAVRRSIPLVTADRQFFAAVKSHPYLAAHIIALASLPGA
ncbi:MAG TPA: type II toxin-antitoxin system VapC family toxin [Stellaceae bacterium]|nr:type II toxin-antitoxin system VapC family toxin [Stellaceae bacterium]